MKKPEALRLLLDRFPWLKNRYIMAFLIFLVWIFFFDGNSLVSQYRKRRELTELRQERKYYQDEIRETKEKLRELFTDQKTLEKFAREQYLMKRADEEIWMIVDTSSTKKR